MKEWTKQIVNTYGYLGFYMHTALEYTKHARKNNKVE